MNKLAGWYPRQSKVSVASAAIINMGLRSEISAQKTILEGKSCISLVHWGQKAYLALAGGCLCLFLFCLLPCYLVGLSFLRVSLVLSRSSLHQFVCTWFCEGVGSSLSFPHSTYDWVDICCLTLFWILYCPSTLIASNPFPLICVLNPKPNCCILHSMAAMDLAPFHP